jgi:hypothetical protein
MDFQHVLEAVGVAVSGVLEAAGRITESVGRLTRIVRIGGAAPAGAAPPILDPHKSSAPEARE